MKETTASNCFSLRLHNPRTAQLITIVFNVRSSQPSVTPDVVAPVSAILALLIHAYKMVLNGIKSLVLTVKIFTLRFSPVRTQVYTDNVTFSHHPYKRKNEVWLARLVTLVQVHHIMNLGGATECSVARSGSHIMKGILQYLRIDQH